MNQIKELDIIGLVKELAKTEDELKAANEAVESMRAYIAALIKENTMLRRKMANIQLIDDVASDLIKKVCKDDE